MAPLLTAYSLYSEATVEELKSAGRTKVPATEIAERWRNLGDTEKKPFEEKASAAQEKYLEECTQKYLDDEGGDDEEGGDEDGDGEEGEGEGEGEGDAGEGEAEQDDFNGRTSSTMLLPFARVKRIAQDHLEHGNIVSREATFIASKATEILLDRCVWGAVRYMSRTGRKTLSPADLVGSLKHHPVPEKMQFFVEELAPAPPAPPPKPEKPAKGGKDKAEKKEKAEKGGKRKSAGEAEAEAPAADEDKPPPKKKGRPPKSKEAEAEAEAPAEEEKPPPAKKGKKGKAAAAAEPEAEAPAEEEKPPPAKKGKKGKAAAAEPEAEAPAEEEKPKKKGRASKKA